MARGTQKFTTGCYDSLICCENEVESISRGVSATISQEANKFAVEFSSHNKVYWNNVSLALSMAFYVTLFGLPVYSPWVSWYVFGEQELLEEGQLVGGCDATAMGFKVNIGTEHHLVLVDYNTTFMAAGVAPYAWCGLLPRSYIVWWPNVVQTAVFAVFRNTGSTVKLAWQCLCGTFTATLNIYMLSYFFPEGAQSENYMEWVVWLDLVVVLFLYLASSADVNTMTWGMNWTVTFMLHVMNPNIGPTVGTLKTWIPYVSLDGETTCVMLTSIAGCFLAVLASVFPRPRLNIQRVHDDAMVVTQGMRVCFDDALDYYCGQDETPTRFQIYARIDALGRTTAQVAGNIADSFWETFNMCGYGKVRTLYHAFNSTIKHTDDEMYCLKVALQQITFDEKHKHFATAAGPSMKELVRSALEVLQECASCCKDGQITGDESASIMRGVMRVEARQLEITKKYVEVMEHEPYISKDFAADNLFMFSLSRWACEITEFAKGLVQTDAKVNTVHKHPLVRLFELAWGKFTQIFNPRHMIKKEQLHFTATNGIPIMITYIIAMYVDGSIFIRYSPTMVGTLTLLVTTDSGAAFLLNVQRLMGVTFGNVLPLLTICVVQLLNCGSYLRLCIHALSLFIFFFCSTFMYYTSDQWAAVGLCIAGFGVFPLLTECSDNLDAHYRSRYKEIANVVIAILIKMLIASLMSPSEPRDTAVLQLEELERETLAAFEAFFNGDLEALRAKFASARALRKECERIAPKCDPTLLMVPGARTRFKYELYNATLVKMKLIESDLGMLLSAMADDEQAPPQGSAASAAPARAESNLHSVITNHQQVYLMIRRDVMETMTTTFSMLQAVLKQDTEDPINCQEVEKLRKMGGIMELSGLEEFYTAISNSVAAAPAEATVEGELLTHFKRTRLTLAVNALALATRHTGEITAACFQNMLQS